MAISDNNQNKPDRETSGPQESGPVAPSQKPALSETWSTIHMLALDSTRLSGQAQTASLPMGNGITKVYSTGDIIDNSYRLLSLLGAGGMGVVFHCQHLILGKEYALKILAADKLSSESWTRFQSEAKALARLHHPGVVGIHNMGIDAQGCPYYVMDLLEGESLSQAIKANHRLPQARVLPIFIQLADALDSAHQQGIIHRDIKPSNVMVLHEMNIDKVKLVDFGIARLSTRGVSGAFNSQNKTAAGTVFGTPYYMSPEQSLGKTVDHRSDIYSLGCALFEALTGIPPFCGANAFETIMMHQSNEAPSLNSVYPEGKFSSSLESAVAKMLQKNVEDRYQSMKQVGHDLSRIQEGKTVGIAHVEKTTSDDEIPEQSSKGMLVAIAITALLVLSAGAFGIYSLTSNTASAPVPKLASVLNEDEKIENEDLIGKWRKVFTDHFNQSKPFCQRTLNDKGQPIKQFAFPSEECHLGYIRREKGEMQKAIGKIDVPVEEKVYLYLQCVCTPFPAICDRFGSDNVNGLEIVTFKPDEVIQRLQNWKKLEHLSFFNSVEREKGIDCSTLLKEHIPYIDTLTNLRTLGLCGELRVGPPDKGEELTGQDICRLTLLSTLQGLMLQEVRNVRPLLREINRHPNLKELTLVNLDINNEDIAILSANNNINKMTIFNCPGVTVDSIPAFARMKGLKRLIIDKEWKTQKDKVNLKDLPAYEYENYKTNQHK
ncbi:MAG: serine/threonine-protein kinase [Candidatus Melainabacteria bacterium]|nr:serine/threonine-protein kinase [Candidatus Melainabacteria bacterium]